MPELSRFYGVIVRMFMEVGAPHHLPHFHAYYQEDVAVYTIDPVELIAGHFPEGSGGSSRHGRNCTRAS